MVSWRRRVVTRTFRCARFCLWRITCALCSLPEMRISKAVADETSSSRPWAGTRTAGMPTSLWSRLPVETRRQLAQQVGQLVQRLRLQSVRSEEGDRANHDVVG